MRIGIDISVLNDKNRTGIGVYTYELIKHYLEIDKENDVILFGFATFSTSGYLKSLFKENARLKVKIFKMPAFAFRRVFILWQKLNWPNIELFVGNVDIYHNFNWYLPPQKHGKTIATVFDVTSIKYPMYHHSNTVQLDKIRFDRINKYADLVISISESAKRDFLNLYPEKKVEVIYPSIQQVSAGTLTVSELLKKYNIKKEGYILAVSTFEPRKNLSSLISAYLELDTDKKLVLVGGEGWKNEELNDLIKANKDKIIKTGFVENKELIYLYKNAFCFVYPSFYEGFGIPVLAALKFGVPVICSKNSSLPEVAGKAVIFINPENYKSIKKAMKKLIKDEKLRRSLIKMGYQQSKKFSWEKSTKILKSIYDSSN